MMIAGAGSGKTTSLVKALERIKSTRGAAFRRNGQRVACITYTDLASKEIWEEVGSSPMFHVSTIHSFLWTVIQPFTEDIRDWVRDTIDSKIARDNERIAKPRTRENTRASLACANERREAARDALADVSSFSYGTGSNYAKGVLGHSDIIQGGSELLRKHRLLRSLVARRFPVIFVDESQDTDPNFVSVLKLIQQDEPSSCIGFFGDPMQKIYPAGIGAIDSPDGWVEITKPENFRCPKKVLAVINRIRADDDGLQQVGGGPVSKIDGTARVFILPADDLRTERLESVRQWLASTDGDELWLTSDQVRVLVLVHRMAAHRMGFPGLYAALNDHGRSGLKDGFLDGSAWVLRPFIRDLLPLAAAAKSKDDFEVISLLRQTCPRLSAERVADAQVGPLLLELGVAVDRLVELFHADSGATIGDVLSAVATSELVGVDHRFAPYTSGEATGEAYPDDSIVRAYLDCPAIELLGYREYLEQRSPFATHQGVKGAEFNRVLVLLDDEEGRHPHFSYGKYFGYVPLSATDTSNQESGKDSALERTRRLLYVCCSRAERDLAVVLFSPDADRTRRLVAEMGLFPEEDLHGLEVLPPR